MPGVKGDCQKEPQESTQAWGWVDGGARFLACLAQLSAALLSLSPIVYQMLINVAPLMPTAFLITGPTVGSIWSRTIFHYPH